MAQLSNIPSAPEHRAQRLFEIARLFLRLGATAFGGPAAHIALLEHEVVQRRAWMTRAEFLDYLGITNLIPGPNSTEMAIHVGRRRAGLAGLVVAGASFIAPASVLVCVLAWAYVTYGALPQLQGLLYGIKPVVMAIVAHVLWGLSRTALKSVATVAVGAGSIAALILGVHELVVLAGAAAVMAIGLQSSDRDRAQPSVSSSTMPVGWATTGAATFATASAAAPFGLLPLFVVFLKIGSVLFGSGYVLLAFLRADLVERLGWLTERQLLDATAVGLVTPGPVFTAATFVGYLLGGVAGAAVATAGIFLPAFVFVAISAPLLPRLRQSRLASAALDGVNAASLALMAVVSVQLARTALVDVATVVLGGLSLIAVVRWRMNSAWLIAAGALAGVLLHGRP